MNRNDKILSCIDPQTQSGLEIGALCRPVVKPGIGPIKYVDHLDTPTLRSKYANDANVDVDQIVDVSYVWGSQTLPEAVGDERFDYVIASHVIEHVPDTIGWLREIATVLKPGGKLSLVIPDKRYTFDAARENTGFAAVVEAYLLGRRHPGFREVLDHFSNAVALNDGVALHAILSGSKTAQELPLNHPGMIEVLGEDGLRHYFNLINGGLYMDVHVHVYTPASVLALLAKLAAAGLLQMRVAAFESTVAGEIEFFITLEKLPDDMPAAQRRDAILASLQPWLHRPLMEQAQRPQPEVPAPVPLPLRLKRAILRRFRMLGAGFR
ncbi:methyltransferase domain-containing protein [Chitinimonas sp.]|uniref:methyltransferase domain-containing protein n=1 Tax=Chitinimonas sp. TaxID=1934313 RepID=UPI0035B3615D